MKKKSLEQTGARTSLNIKFEHSYIYVSLGFHIFGKCIHAIFFCYFIHFLIILVIFGLNIPLIDERLMKL